MRILARIRDEDLRSTLAEAARRLDAELLEAEGEAEEGEAEHAADVVVAELDRGQDMGRLRGDARHNGAALVVACHRPEECKAALGAEADELLLLPADVDEIELRLAAARGRVRVEPTREAEAAELVRYEKLLYDRLTGFPTLPVMIQRAHEILDRRGEITILYIHFVWYEKIEQIYGWQKLDDVLQTTAQAVREFYAREHGGAESLMMVSHTGDDNFILFTQIPTADEVAERRVQQLSRQLEHFLHARIEERHGEEIASLCGIYVGSATAFRNPKIRTERLIYRSLREAAQAARGAEAWERASKVADLKATLREEAVFMEYHPIIVAATEEVYGYEALARGTRRELRSPEVLFDAAEQANLIWELSRLLRRRAVEGILDELEPDQYLFLNVDPHDFDDPSFRNLDAGDLGLSDPGHVVLEITERIAIKDYPRFQAYLAAFRERGFRFAVDDAGSGYAGLGSIANLDPDYIKLDISLISSIDSNFLKQNLVETMVNFAETHGTRVIAEGVERREEFETVRELGVHLAQGFLFHRPKYAGKPVA